jgi:AraC-like DNA-binding protein
MVLAPIRNPTLLRSVRHALLAVEDVFTREEDIFSALHRGFPGASIIESGPEARVVRAIRAVGQDLPIVEIARLDVLSFSSPPPAVVIPPIDTAPARMRQLIDQAALPMTWVERLLRDLGQAAGSSLPLGVKSLGRRVLEFPSRYSRTSAVAAAVGLTPGALKARFQRFGLPSPLAYTAWLRALGASDLLTWPGMTTDRVAFHLGYSSSGNFCRAFRNLTGLRPSEATTIDGRMLVLTRLASELLSREQIAAWARVESLFTNVA